MVAHPGHRQVGKDVFLVGEVSNATPPVAAAMKVSWVWQTPLGLPVVPEV